MPKVTVVVPLYQTEHYIEAALKSVVAQTFEDIEILVIDDGSRDRGPDIARSIDDPRIVVITQENRGLAGARNSGIRHAQGQYIALLDADDMWAPTKIAQHVAQLDEDPMLDVSFSASRLIDGDGNDIGLIQSPKSRSFTLSDFFCRNPIGNGSAPVVRRDAFERIAFHDDALDRTCWFDESFRQSEDVECWMRLAAQANCTFGYIDQALTLYRVNSGGLSANVDKQFATWQRFRDKVEMYAPEVVREHGRRAEAYQLRYLARRAVYSEQRTRAASLAFRAVYTYPRIFLEEPGRSGVTLLAAFAKVLMPGRVFIQLERVVLGYASNHPSLRF